MRVLKGETLLAKRSRLSALCGEIWRWLGPTLALTITLFWLSEAYAQRLALNGILNSSSGGITNRPLILMVALAGLALVPFILIMVTSFVKIAVVLSIVRQAVGTQQIPPTQVITGLSIIMTVYIMAPVGLEMFHNGQDKMIELKIKDLQLDKIDPDDVGELLGVVEVPMRAFLANHAHPNVNEMFYTLAWRMRKPRDRATLTRKDFMVITPSFVISELKEAFQIGFILFVPFLVVDMVVANILMALGMQMLSPTTISLPFKVLLFVLVDGWYLISQGLVVGYHNL